MREITLSIVIVSYNTKEILKDCLESLKKVKDEVEFETIVSDNASIDGSVEMVKKNFPWVKLIENKDNLGFSKGNNAASNLCKGEYVLFLNSDTVVHKDTLKKTYEYLERNRDVGSVTCKIVLPNGKLDKDTRRSFPSPWVSFTHLVSPLDRIFPKSKTFAKYWYGYISENETHEVDVIQGAFHMTRKEILDKLGWFDEDYFLDGEDIDLCWRIKKIGYKIIYYPKVTITHVKKASKKKPTRENRRRFATSGVESMEIFYKKNMWNMYPLVINYLVISGIRLVRLMRNIKISLT